MSENPWSALWTDTGVLVNRELTDAGECVFEIAIEFVDSYLREHGMTLTLDAASGDIDNDDLVNAAEEVRSAYTSTYECSFHLAQRGWNDELVAARVMEAVMYLPDAEAGYPRELVLGAIKAGYQFGARTRGNSLDEIWDAWQTDPRSITARRAARENNQP